MLPIKFKPKSFYQNYRISGLYMHVDRILGKEGDSVRLLVTWWKKDDSTQKRIKMDVQQETVIPESEYGNWILVS